jgi:prenyltransferase beta subunit
MPENNNIAVATGRLTIFVKEALSRPLEIVRIARTAQALLLTGIAGSDDLIQQATNFFLQKQRSDGGWSDPEETAWAISCISLLRGQEDPAVQAAIKWLNNARLPTGGWGRHPRDQARIPITALISSLVPAAFKREDIDWLQHEWARDFRGPVLLSYKAGFYLLAMPQGQEDELVEHTIAHLEKDQNSDGGFAPWKDHPMGSEAWSTGVVLWGLARWIGRVNHAVLERALNWLQQTQLPSGYWPYHYLDDGASLALIGAVAAMKALAATE